MLAKESFVESGAGWGVFLVGVVLVIVGLGLYALGPTHRAQLAARTAAVLGVILIALGVLLWGLSSDPAGASTVYQVVAPGDNAPVSQPLGLKAGEVIAAALLGFILPGLSSLLGRCNWPSEVLGLLTAVLALVTGVVEEAVAAGNFDLSEAGLKALLAYTVAALARGQFWRGTQLDKVLLAKGSGEAGKALLAPTPPGGMQPGWEPAGIEELEEEDRPSPH